MSPNLVFQTGLPIEGLPNSYFARLLSVYAILAQISGLYEWTFAQITCTYAVNLKKKKLDWKTIPQNSSLKDQFGTHVSGTHVPGFTVGSSSRSNPSEVLMVNNFSRLVPSMKTASIRDLWTCRVTNFMAYKLLETSFSRMFLLIVSTDTHFRRTLRISYEDHSDHGVVFILDMFSFIRTCSSYGIPILP